MQVRIGEASPYRHLRGQWLYLDPSVLSRVQRCDYGECESACCRFGTFVSDDRRRAIEQHIDGIRPFMAEAVAATDFAQLVPFSGIWPKDRMYPGAPLYETLRHRGTCCFVTEKPDGKSGCAIHKYADSAGLAWKQLKPNGCVLFPLLLSVTDAGRVRLFKARRRNYACCNADPVGGERLIDIQRKSVEYLFDLTAAEFEALRDGLSATAQPVR